MCLLAVVCEHIAHEVGVLTVFSKSLNCNDQGL